jgi:hypothetical protein
MHYHKYIICNVILFACVAASIAAGAAMISWPGLVSFWAHLHFPWDWAMLNQHSIRSYITKASTHAKGSFIITWPPPSALLSKYGVGPGCDLQSSSKATQLGLELGVLDLLGQIFAKFDAAVTQVRPKHMHFWVRHALHSEICKWHIFSCPDVM